MPKDLFGKAMKTRKCYACDKRFDSDSMEKTPHKEWECESCFCERWQWCGICKEYQLIDWDDPCRHIFYWSSEWLGSGSHDWDYHKKSAFSVFDKVGERCVSAMAKALYEHTFNLQYHGTIFGSEGICLFVNGQEYGQYFTRNLSEHEESEMAVGVGWLNSLQPGKTKQADDETLVWIYEWEELRNRHLTISFFREVMP